jgi:hypothetical protein
VRAPAPSVRPSREQAPRASKGGRRGAPDRSPGKSDRASANAGSHRGRGDGAPRRNGRSAEGASDRPPHDAKRHRPRGAPDRNPGKSSRSSTNVAHGGRNDNAPFRQARSAKGGSHRSPQQHDGERQRPRDHGKPPHRGGHRPYKGRRDR